MAKDKKIGKITHFYSKLGVGIVKLSGVLKTGDAIKVKGAKNEFEQEVKEMQLNHQNIASGKKGQEVGIKMEKKVREGNEVYLLG